MITSDGIEKAFTDPVEYRLCSWREETGLRRPTVSEVRQRIEATLASHTSALAERDARIAELEAALKDIIRADDTGPMIYAAYENGPSQAIGGSEGKFAAIARAALAKEQADA